MTAKEVAADILRRCYSDRKKHPEDRFLGLDVEIETAITRAVAEEREACAQLADTFRDSLGMWSHTSARIRARGQT